MSMRSMVMPTFLALLAGCHAPAPSERDDGLPSSDGDADTDADADGTDSDVPVEPPACPAYPAATGMEAGDVVPNFALPGNGPDGESWSLQDLWCKANDPTAENPPTVLIMAIHSMTCAICLGVAAPELQSWYDRFGSRGLVPMGVSINEGRESARRYWEEELQHTHPWVADVTFSTLDFFNGLVITTPAYIVVDLSTMRVVLAREGFSGGEEILFHSLLRPE